MGRGTIIQQKGTMVMPQGCLSVFWRPGEAVTLPLSVFQVKLCPHMAGQACLREGEHSK